MILTAGLSPAWQQILTFSHLTFGDVNRAETVQWCVSGKVLNVGRAVWSLSGGGHTLCLAGGQTGNALRREFLGEHIPVTWVETEQPTRICTTLVDRSSSPPQVTELIENAAAITTEELAAFETKYGRLANSANIVVLTGSLPEVFGEGRPVDVWARLLRQSPCAVLDLRGPELLTALAHHPRLIKPNREELARTLGRELTNEPTIIAAIRQLTEAGAEWGLVTDGPNPALLANDTEAWRFTPPPVETVNPIGCGDCLAAGVAVALQEGAPMVEAVRFGMAASAENARQLLPARLSLDEVQRLVDIVGIERLSS